MTNETCKFEQRPVHICKIKFKYNLQECVLTFKPQPLTNCIIATCVCVCVRVCVCVCVEKCPVFTRLCCNRDLINMTVYSEFTEFTQNRSHPICEQDLGGSPQILKKLGCLRRSSIVKLRICRIHSESKKRGHTIKKTQSRCVPFLPYCTSCKICISVYIYTHEYRHIYVHVYAYI